ncbi:MAG TPA: hypothetical protein VKS81_10745 [Bacteroidota bacterium]|nr:hypothetical protein [Bacteroidota bacterium]
MKHHIVTRVLKGILIAAAACVVLGFAVMLLWNALIPDILGAHVITYWQAVGLLVLSHLLFRGWGGWGRNGWRHDRWKHRFEEKLASMTPEEREKFKEEWRMRCGPSKEETK